jgi:hypothetical protein
MTRLLDLFLLVAPWVALLGGLTILALVALHLAGVRDLPGVARGAILSALAALLLGAALAGLGATYLLTGGATGYDGVYLLWLGVGVLSGLLGTLGDRRR